MLPWRKEIIDLRGMVLHGRQKLLGGLREGTRLKLRRRWQIQDTAIRLEICIERPLQIFAAWCKD
jgi:hypothetical protein